MRLLALFCTVGILLIALFRMSDQAQRNLFYRQMNQVLAEPSSEQAVGLARKALAEAEEKFCQPNIAFDCTQWLSFYYLRWGRKVTELEDSSEADYYFSASVAADPGNAETYFWWGRYKYRNGEPEKAKVFLRNALSERAEDMNFGRSDALFHLAQAIAAQESPANWRTVTPYLQEAIDADDFRYNPLRVKALTYYSLGESKRQSGNYEEAARFYSQAIEENDTVYWAYLRLAEVKCHHFNECADVEDHLLSAISLQPNNSSAYLHLAEYYVTLERYTQAETILRTVLEINPDDSRAKNLLEQIEKEPVE